MRDFALGKVEPEHSVQVEQNSLPILDRLEPSWLERAKNHVTFSADTGTDGCSSVFLA